MKDICSDPAMPSTSMVYRWLADPERVEFRDRYAHAREVQADNMADEILSIADDARNDWMERQDYNGEAGSWQLNGEHIQRSKVRIDSRKWLAAKLKPKVYGDRTAVEHSGEVGLTGLADSLQKARERAKDTR